MKIEWTNPAVSDLQYIRDYIARDSEFFAHRFTQRIIDTIGTLPQFPEIGRCPLCLPCGMYYFFIFHRGER